MSATITRWVPGRFLTCVALALVVLGSRAWLIRAGGSPVPIWDQWDAEATNLYLPWLNGTLRWADLFQAHNEHRILFTRLADLALLEVLGGWNPWAQMLLGALLHAACAGAIAAVFWSATPAQNRASLITGLALLFTATCGWQNATWGFQFQVYLANLFSIGAITGLCISLPLSRGWWLGFGAAVLALFTNGGGLLALAAALPVGLLLNTRNRQTWGAIGIMAGGLVLGSTLSQNAPYHASLHAKTIGQFFAVFSRCLAWPWINHGAMSFIMQLPLAWLGFNRWRRHESLTATERCALALGCFAILQGAAISYSRGGGLLDARPLSRYQDPLLLGVAAQLFAAVQLWSREGRITRIPLLLVGGLAIAGLIALTETNLTLHLPYKRAQDHSSLTVLRTYAITGDAAAFAGDDTVFGRHPNPESIRRSFDEPVLRAILPADLLVPADSPAPVPPWPIRNGPVLTAVSALLLFSLLVRLTRGAPEQSTQVAERS